MAKRGTFWMSGSCSCVDVSRMESSAPGRPTDRLVGDEMMDIVAALPPPHRQATAEIGDENTNKRVNDEVVGDGAMSGIVCGKHNLVLHIYPGY